MVRHSITDDGPSMACVSYCRASPRKASHLLFAFKCLPMLKCEGEKVQVGLKSINSWTFVASPSQRREQGLGGSDHISSLWQPKIDIHRRPINIFSWYNRIWKGKSVCVSGEKGKRKGNWGKIMSGKIFVNELPCEFNPRCKSFFAHLLFVDRNRYCVDLPNRNTLLLQHFTV